MNNMEMSGIVARMKGLYPALRNYTAQDEELMVRSWTPMFLDMSADVVMQAVEQHAKDKASSFIPAASEIYGVAKDLDDPLASIDTERLLNVPQAIDGKCPYGLCDGSGFYRWKKQMYGTGVGYDKVEPCPCEWDRSIAKAVKDGRADRLDTLESEKIRYRGRIEKLLGLEATAY